VREVPIIEVSGLEYSYQAHDTMTVALAGIELEIEPGEFIAVVGRNGSGKSTFAKHLNAILLPAGGRVLVAGMDTREETLMWNIRQAAGMVFQNPDNQIVATVVEEDVAFGPENLGVPTAGIHERVDLALKLVDMEEYRGHAPHLLSGGQKQRVAIAGVLAMKPAIIILDEATAMLDPVGRAEVMSTITRLNREEGMTAIIITHHMDEAVQANRVVVFHEGKVVQNGTPREVFQKHSLLEEIGLDVPLVTRLATELKHEGLSLEPVLTVAELVEALCQLR
jgi:energy-coupling factor transport system ATP-binding protein